MGKASSSKKIKRVQQAGATRAPGQRRQLGYPALIAVIIVVGLVATALAVLYRRDVEQVRPTVDDNWVAAYGTYICDGFIDSFDTIQPDAPVDLHADGLLHIHPTEEENAGENAVFGLYTTSAGITLGAAGSLTLPDGTTYTDGDDCNGEPGRVALFQWPPQSSDTTEPRIITTNIAGTRFTEDGQTYVLAFAPRGAEVPLPPSTDKIDEPDDAEPEVAESTEATPTTVAPGGEDGATDTVAPEISVVPEDPGSTDTTLPAGDSTTTSGG